MENQVQHHERFQAHHQGRNSQKKQIFLRHQFGKDSFILANDVADLLEDQIYDTNAKSMVLMPYFNHLAAGIPCTSRTPLSSKASQNLNCVQNGTAATGTASGNVLNLCEKYLPNEAACECVTNLQQRANPSDMSDAEFITSKFIALGYWAMHMILSAAANGAPFPRERLWWVALRSQQSRNMLVFCVMSDETFTSHTHTPQCSKQSFIASRSQTVAHCAI